MVVMPLGTYRLIRLKTYKSDSLIALKNDILNSFEDKIGLKDTLIKNLGKKIKIHEKNELHFGMIVNEQTKIIESKEQTISELNGIKWYERKETWISGGIGLILGILIAK